ncbi:hypothetical protein [Flavonifractor hominis]|uniref:Uncharacterized protein n=1 Tax=Flavonifractor hominis TaxID=3133178 RepID=A0ABV1EKW6_9FIRM
MADFEEKLNAILNDPEAMGQIASIAKSLSGESKGESEPQTEDIQSQRETPPLEDTDWSSLLGLLGGNGEDSTPLSALAGLDPRLLQAGIRLFSEYSAADDRKVALLTALKPFVKPERYAKVDRAVQIAKLARVIRVAFQLFQDSREEEKRDV